MDLAERTRTWLADLFSDRQPPASSRLRDDARFEVEGGPPHGLDPEGFQQWCRSVVQRCGALELHVEEAVPRRNVVFASFHAVPARRPAAGTGTEAPGGGSRGVAVVSWDQDGRVLHVRLMWTPPEPRINAASGDGGPAPGSRAASD